MDCHTIPVKNWKFLPIRQKEILLEKILQEYGPDDERVSILYKHLNRQWERVGRLSCGGLGVPDYNPPGGKTP